MADHDTSRDAPSHHTGARKGEELANDKGNEAGRHDKEQSGQNRPAGGSTARDSTSINPDDRNPIDPKMPNMPPS